ncbi:MAG: DUF4249 domain-containing protein [candidate division KSB1 bacterium]|nr:DUF4249 domain-containing protein [candidate division KSB1 bacterium]MDZ7273376.1 DUF4249 domain-containing protein [candidate division KSB1 bacterium]MDZ7288038.1 DUF4249 domain-containing protein [candidate division KSB1 bacterium]MDZ7300110.1 DUF4249 domain-containing protein [candidate division KSB1 bacterium]MDZ7308935.1 DUF4249 domain-containing protein [candidate division KSB1 bacterium]
MQFPPAASLLLLVMAAFLLACSEQPTEPVFAEKLVVNGFLRLGGGVDSIVVSRTVAIEERFDVAHSRVRGALVRLRRQNDRWFTLRERHTAAGDSVSLPGVYFLPPESLQVESGQTYELQVTALGQTVTAQTTVPPQISLLEANRGLRYGDRPLLASGDTVEYVSGKSFADAPLFSLFWPPLPGVSLYRVIADADNNDFRNLIRDTTTAANIFKGDLQQRKEPFGFNIAFTPDYNPMRARISWLYFNYYGWHTIRLLAMDEAYARYMQGQLDDGAQREMPKSNIVGGYGILASYSEVKLRVYLKKGPRSEPGALSP